ncbi:MAG: hypothetical protein NTZ27_12515 [Ignavibacteriales bacterium]|nr:hypothetical protein [Ignavibacteriales bacterium]
MDLVRLSISKTRAHVKIHNYDCSHLEKKKRFAVWMKCLVRNGGITMKLSPIVKDTFHGHEEEPISIPYSKFLGGSIQNFQLFPKEDNFELKLCFRFETTEAERKQRSDRIGFLLVNYEA